jgi:arylsulfatase A-like enzyme
MTKLRELQQEENTLIFLISDNGGAYQNAEMGGLRGHKWFVWEGGIRVSWLAAWKGHIPAGRVSDEPVIQLDVLPTALAASGSIVVPPSGVQSEPAKAGTTILDGVNLLPLLEGKTDKLAPRELYFRFGVQHAVRQGDWKLVKASKDMQPMLVNLATDPGEQTDLTAKEPEKARPCKNSSTNGMPPCKPPAGRTSAGTAKKAARKARRRSGRRRGRSRAKACLK